MISIKKVVNKVLVIITLVSLQAPYLMPLSAQAEETTPTSGQTTQTSVSHTSETSSTPTTLSPVDTSVGVLNSTVTTDPTIDPVDPILEEEEPVEEPKNKPGIEEEEPEPEVAEAVEPVVESPLPQKEQPKTTIKPEIDQTTGALSYSYPFTLPEGRAGHTPSLSLSYNSQETSNDSITGYGWNLSIPSIKRINKYGVDKLYDPLTETFVSSLDGELIKITNTNTYRPKVDQGTYHLYTYTNNSWSMTDKEGTTYAFGTTSQSRQDDPTDSSRIFQWNVETMTDANSNIINYTYTKDQGQVYPQSISYAPTFSVDFTLEQAPKRLSAIYGFFVTTEKRISQIDIKTDNTTTKTYTLDYTNADNGQETLLGSVTESAIGTPTITLPPTTFDYTVSTPGWTYDPSWNIPIESYEKFGFRLADINGDGLPDIVCHNGGGNSNPCKYNHSYTFLNTGTYFTTPPGIEWQLPIKGANTNSPGNASQRETFNYGSDTYKETGLQIFEFNGDRLPDLVYKKNNYNYVYINNGVNGWDRNQSLNIPTEILVSKGVRIADFNSDGLDDAIYARYSNNGAYGSTYRNEYANFDYGPWMLPTEAGTNHKIGFVSKDYEDKYGWNIIDLNNDQLPDFIRSWGSSPIHTQAYLNNGKDSWVYYPNYISLPLATKMGLPTMDYGLRLVDVNGDRIFDIVCHNLTPSGNVPCKRNVPYVFLNTDSGFAANGWELPKEVDSNYKEAFTTAAGKDTGLRLVDVNGDGMVDLLKNNDDDNYAYINNTHTRPNLMKEIVTPTGLNTDITYKPSTQYTDINGALLNPHLPLIIDTVESVVTTDPVTSVSSRSDYTYSGGEYFYQGPHDKQFAGFEKVEEKIYDNVTNTLMKRVVSYFHQGDLDNTIPNTNASLASIGEQPDTRSKIGKVFRTEIYDGGGVLQEKTMIRYGQTQIVPGSFLVYTTSTLTQSYDGATHTDNGHIYTYTAQGNLATDTDFGVVAGQNNGSFADSGTDKKTTTYTYIINGAIQKPSKVSIKNYGNVIEKESKYTYGNTGNLTKVENMKAPGVYISTNYTYNAQGNLTSQTDPNGNTTTYTYGASNLYPTTVTEPLSLTTTYLYNDTLGKITQMTDPNNRTWKWTYDALGRTLTEQIPYDSNPSTQITKTTYLYFDTPTPNNPTYVRKTNSGPTTNEYTLLDGSGKPIRTLTQTGGATYAGTDTTYDALGRTLTTSLPFSYATTPTTYTGVLAPANLQTTYTYDGHDRVTSSTDVFGTTSTNYSGLTKTVTDVMGKQKKYTTDTRGNLTKVEEKLGATWYPTTYLYDTSNNLTKITDSLSNVRNFTYDALGRRVTADDLHAPLDVTFGTYTYTYDNNGNLISQLTPQGDTIQYTYDARNRVLTEKLSTDPSPRISYTYDQGTDGKTRLTNISQSNGTTTAYTYTGSGKKKTETVTIPGSAPALFSYGYDIQGSTTRTTYPDLTQTITTYSYRNLPTQVQYQANGVNTNLASSVTYNNPGSVLSYTRANGVTTTNTYNQNLAYRLTQKVSQKSGQPKLQDITYTYDAAGNITTLVDNSVSTTKKTATYTYDDLYRLTSATITNVAAGQTPYTETFTYNPVGNLLSKNGTTYSYTTPNKTNPHAPTTIGGQTLTYNDNGNLLTDGTHTNAWNYKNELVSSTSNNVTATYLYNHEGQRTKKVTPSTTTYSPTSFYSEEGTDKTKTISLGDLQLGTIETATILGVTTHTPRYAITDHLGSIEKTTDSNAAIVSTLDYFPYGSTRIDTGGTPERGYIGERYDPESGYSYLNARYYNSQYGVFNSQDPVFWKFDKDKQLYQRLLTDPQQFNSYSYSRNNPVMNKDPNGQSLVNALFFGRYASEQDQQDLSMAVGYQYNNSATWKTALDNPVATGVGVAVGAGLVAAAAAPVATALVTQANIGFNLARLSSLPMLSRVDATNKGFDVIQKATGLSKADALNLVASSGQSLVETRVQNFGNINNVFQVANKVIRITTNPQATRIISSGVISSPSKLSNYMSSGAMKPISSIASIAKGIGQFINSIKK